MVGAVLKTLTSSSQNTEYKDRIGEVREHLAATSKILRELEDDLSTRMALLHTTQAKAYEYERLASINAQQAQAIDAMVGRQFKRQGRASAIYWWAGVVLAFVLGLVVNRFSAPLWAWITG